MDNLRWEFRKGGPTHISFKDGSPVPDAPPHIVMVYRDEENRRVTRFVAQVYANATDAAQMLVDAANTEEER